MKDYPRVLTVQDLSCLGQCSAAVAQPILSVCGCEAVLLPTMLLSTHTGGLGTPVRRDLTEDMLPVADHWQQQGISFDGICVGYLGKAQQARMVAEIADKMTVGPLIVDPAMADHGRLYRGIEEDCVEAMKTLCRQADVILPNVTEACLLAGESCREPDSRQDYTRLLAALEARYGDAILLTGVSLSPEQTGFALRCGGQDRYYQRPRVGGGYHGTGDQFAAVFSGALLRGWEMYDAAVLAAEFVARVAENTAAAPAHAYGTRFEGVLPWLAQQMNQ